MTPGRIVKTPFYVLFFALISSVKVSDSNDGQQTDDGSNCNDKGSDRYFIGSLQTLFNWTSANEICRSQNALLPVIQNDYEQNAFERYLKCLLSNEAKIQDIWLSGKMETLNQWTWINDQTWNKENAISSQSDKTRTHAMLRRGQNFTAEPPSHQTWYMCQYKDGHSRCNNKRSVKLTDSCLIPSEYGNTSWYESRNECRDKGGDLAVLTQQDQLILKNHTFPNLNYWVGLRKVKWVWITDIGNREIAYTKWQPRVGHPDSGDFCISANASNGNWRPSSCSGTSFAVCDKHEIIAVSSTISSVTDKSTINEDAQSCLTLIVGLVLGIGVIVPLLVVTTILFIVVVNQRKKLKKMSTNRNDTATAEAHYQELREVSPNANSSDYTTLQLM